MIPEIISSRETTPDQVAAAEGKAAYFTGSEINPYPRNTNKWYSWLRGWGVARSEDHVKKMN